jgi:xanthine dehydrogenase accessory factor
MNAKIYQELLNQLEAGKKAVVITTFNGEPNQQKNIPSKLLATEENIKLHSLESSLDSGVVERIVDTLQNGKLQVVKSDEKTYLLEPYFPEPQVIIFGAGHIGKPVAEFAKRVGFSVTVIDDRPSFANKERFPTADRVICESFDKCFDQLHIHPFTFVVIVTRGHRHDMDCLRKVLDHHTAYTGMIGSKRRIKGVIEKMRKEGFSQAALDLVHAPIGLDIGAITPDEIAFSIVSELIRFRRYANLHNQKVAKEKCIWPEFDPEVISELSHSSTPKAIITIVETKGSVPRKAGAKMIVEPYGKLLGSIGGGCSEGAVITNARDVIINGSFEFQRVDMTGAVAEDEGMACGGIMDVIIEYFQ